MRNTTKILLLFGVIVFTAFSCEEDEKPCGCPPYSIIPSSPYNEPAWHPSGNIIGFNHCPIKEINYTNGYHCPLQAVYTYEEDSIGFWLINVDGTNQRRVLPYFLQTPAWSPDGKWIAFVQGAQIFKMPFGGEIFDTTNITQLTFEGQNYFPAWSPNGDWLVYDSNTNSENGGYFIWKTKNDGSKQRRIIYTPGEGATRMPFWGVNNLIVHQKYVGIGAPEIFTIDTAGNNANRITENNDWESYPKFSKTSEKIAYISQITGKIGLYITNTNNGANEQLLASEALNFSWSPDNKHIVYLHYKYYRIDEIMGTLWIVNTENNDKRQLTFNSFNLIQ